MPLDPSVMKAIRVGAYPQLDPEVTSTFQATDDAIARRKKLMRDKYGWDLTAPLSGTRGEASERAVREVTDLHDRELLLESVREVSKAQEFAREKEYAESGYAGRFLQRSQQVLGEGAGAGTAIIGAAEDFRNWAQGRGRTTDEVRFRRQLEAAKQGEDPSLGKDAPLSLRMVAGGVGMAPDLSAGLLAGKLSGGRLGMFLYWTARLFPGVRENLVAQGNSPAVAATAGAVTAAGEAAIELLNVGPPGLKSLGRTALGKGVVRRGISEAIEKFGGKQLIAFAAKYPIIRTIIGGAIDGLERSGVEVVEEGIQAGTRRVGEYLAAFESEDIEGPVFADIAPEMRQEMIDTAPAIFGLGITTGGGGIMGDVSARRQETKQVRIDKEITEHAAEGKVPSRSTWKRWGMPADVTSRFERQEHMRRMADEIAADERVQVRAREIAEMPPERAQEAGVLARKAGVPITPEVTEAAVGAQGEIPAGKEAEPRKWDEPATEETSARIEAQQAAEEARPLSEGFLAGEAGAKPLVGKLGERKRRDIIGSGELIDMGTGDKGNDLRLAKARVGVPAKGFLEHLRDTVSTSWKYATRPQVNIPATEKFASANEFFRLLKAVPPAAVDEAIRTVAAVVDPLGPQQMELFENAIVAQNMMRTIEKNATLPEGERESLRQGFTEERARAWHDKIFGYVETTPEVKNALEMRGKIVRETVTKLVAKGFLQEAALADPERYFHQQVLQVQEAKRQAGAVGGARRKKRSFMMGRVTGVDLSAEEYDYSTSYVESETEWLSDAFAELRKAELLEGLVERYDRTKDFQDMAEAQGITLQQAVHRAAGVTFWQPVPGNVFYRAFTIPEKIGSELQRGIIEEANLTVDEVRQATALGGPHKSVVLPVEIADQLDTLEQSSQSHWLTHLNKRAMDSWKAFVLLNPKRIIGYNVRNFTGDMDPVLAADPRILKYMPKATMELLKYHHGRLAISPSMRLARDHGVVSAGFFSSEVSETSELAIFRRLKPEERRVRMRNPAKLYMEIVRPHVEMRENVLRYAAFLAYLDQINTGAISHYGAAKRTTVQTLEKEMGAEVAAAHMSRELLGDYGNMTEAGEWVRGHLYPFWAFQEINLKRYPRLVINAIQSGQGRGRVAAVISTAAMMRIGAWYSTMWTWNNIIYPMLFGGDDENELSEYDRDEPHILLGRNPDGTVRIFRNIGALGDFLEWFGLNEALGLMDEYAAGQATAGDVAWEMWKAPWEKMINLLRPDIKVGYELATGQSLFPDPFNPRSIRRDEAAAGAFGFEDEYKMVKGLVVGRGTRARPNTWQRWFVGVSDPRKAALGQMYDLRARFLKGKGRPEGGVYPVSEYKEARDAASNEDYEAFAEWKVAFQKKYGVKSFKRFKRFLDRLDPIAAKLSDRDEREFEFEYLTVEQRKKLQMTRDYSADLRDLLIQWWVASEQEEPSNWENNP